MDWRARSAQEAMSLASAFLRESVRTVEAVRVHESGGVLELSALRHAEEDRLVEVVGPNALVEELFHQGMK
eukprot:1597216-Pyramimonas_sp.AAC.1